MKLTDEMVRRAAKGAYECQRDSHLWPAWDDLPFNSPNSAHHSWLKLARAALTAALADVPARLRLADDIDWPNLKCRHGCDNPVGIFHVPKGCVCWPDPVHALCMQHFIKAESTGPVMFIADFRVGSEPENTKSAPPPAEPSDGAR